MGAAVAGQAAHGPPVGAQVGGRWQQRGGRGRQPQLAGHQAGPEARPCQACRAPGCRCLCRPATAAPAGLLEEQILKEAVLQRVDLILVRSHGKSGFMKALLGSTAGEILKAAPCPVLVARV